MAEAIAVACDGLNALWGKIPKFQKRGTQGKFFLEALSGLEVRIIFDTSIEMEGKNKL